MLSCTHVHYCSTCLIIFVILFFLRLLFNFVALYNGRYEGMDRFIRTGLKLQPNTARFVATKVAMDGLIFGPLDLLVFLSYMGYSSGKNTLQVKEDLKRDFLPAFILQGAAWPILQIANFRYVPLRFQLLYVNMFCLVDSAFLSWLEQQQDASWKQFLTSSITSKGQDRR